MTPRRERGTGSSPLARGLREQVRGDGINGRIIPARAGFTGRRPGGSPPWSDHPRSRGVYGYSPGRDIYHFGSSPLARGLHLHIDSHQGLGRIIPARAGFTQGRLHVGLGGPDHPRSRGVYPICSWIFSAVAGSSPLARGLLLCGLRQPINVGIIPARAGFTPEGNPVVEGVGDHPRSRGVYAYSYKLSVTSDGSSPLARGLRNPDGSERAVWGIIPARAGFTRSTRGRRRSSRDHPRSRGVYQCGIHRFARPRGSSPLARGLLPRINLDIILLRIIPARAGFTLDMIGTLAPAQDHPRSRGVYKCCPTAARSGPWIIPARAGFTLPQPCALFCHQDHPRSRGVY